MQTILSLSGTPSSSSCTVKPSPKPSNQPRQVASLWMRTGSPFCSLSTIEQTSRKSRPDLLISGCSAALLEPTLPDEQTKQTAIRVKTESKRMEPPSVRRGSLVRGPKQRYSKRVSVLLSCRLVSWRLALLQKGSGFGLAVPFSSSGSSLLINNAPERDEFTIVQARLAEDVSNPARWSLRVTNCRQLIDSGRVSRSKYCVYFSIVLATEMQHWQRSPLKVTPVWTLTKQNGFCESSRVVTS